MIRKIARFKVRRDQIDVAKQAIAEFVAAIAQHEPGTLYEAYHLDDGVSFIHFMGFLDAEAEINHQMAPYTVEFVEVLYPTCEEQPTFSDLTPIRPAE